MKRDYVSLEAGGLSDEFDAEVHGEEPIVDIDEKDQQIIISYKFPGFYMTEDPQDHEGDLVPFKQINISKTGFMAESGRPLLPSFGRYVQIPHGCDWNISVKKGSPRTFEDVMVLPAQETLMDAKQRRKRKREEKVGDGFEFDESLYRRDEYYPAEVVEVSGPLEMDDYRALLLHVRPIQYNPKQGKLRCYSNISIVVDLTPLKVKPADLPSIQPETHLEAYGNLFVNPGRRIEERVSISPERVTLVPFPRGPEYLIIYHSKFKEPAEKLAQWKNHKGIRTKTVSIDDVGTQIGNIKKYIRHMRGQRFSRLRYVLLFGDTDLITTESIVGGTFGSNVTDLYYSTSRDPTDGDDYIVPWLSIGRIPVRNATEGMAVVEQIIAYERFPPCDPEYYRRMAFGAYFQDHEYGGNPDGKASRAYMKTMEDIREHLITLGFDIERIYVAQTPDVQYYVDGTPVPADVKAAIMDSDDATDMLIETTNDGQLITGHRDHGTKDGWHEPPFTKVHLDDVTSMRPTVFYSINCQTGRFDLTAPTDSFAEKMLKMKGAAPSLIAATRNSHTWLNNDLMKGLFDAMWAGVLPTFPDSTCSYAVRHNRLGDIMNYGKTYLPIAQSGSDAAIKDHFEIYHVVGDPTLEIWKALPRTIRLNTKVQCRHLYIRMSACPRNSVISIWYRDKLIKRMQPRSRYIKIPLRGIRVAGVHPSRRKVHIYFWAPGHRFIERKQRV